MLCTLSMPTFQCHLCSGQTPCHHISANGAQPSPNFAATFTKAEKSNEYTSVFSLRGGQHQLIELGRQTFLRLARTRLPPKCFRHKPSRHSHIVSLNHSVRSIGAHFKPLPTRHSFRAPASDAQIPGTIAHLFCDTPTPARQRQMLHPPSTGSPPSPTHHGLPRGLPSDVGPSNCQSTSSTSPQACL